MIAHVILLRLIFVFSLPVALEFVSDETAAEIINVLIAEVQNGDND